MALKLRPFRRSRRNSWQVQFWHPLLKKQVTRGLDTEDLREAQALCEDIRVFLGIAKRSASASELVGFDRRVLLAVFGKNAPEARRAFWHLRAVRLGVS